MNTVKRLGLVMALGAVGVAASGCHYWEKYKSCRDVVVHVVNSEQTLSAVNIAIPGEDFGPQTLLQSGQTRDVILCMDRGQTAKFQAAQNGTVLGIARCTANQSSYEGTSVTVIWTLQGFFCQGW
jgi:hypothetical protein